jgi:hypothetical protein
MSSCKAVAIPVDAKAKFKGLSGNSYHNISEYRSFAGAFAIFNFHTT